MAEYCRECAERCLGFTPEELKHAVWSKELDLCEGCGEYKRVLVRLPAKKLVTNTIKHDYLFNATHKDGSHSQILVTADSLIAASLLLPEDVVAFSCRKIEQK